MEHELVAAARRGDQAAFMDLVRPRSNRLFAIALQILRDIDRAEDALQDALVIAWRDLRERRRAVNLRVLPIDGPAAPDDLLSIADRDQLERGFRRLPPDQRAILVLHHFLGYPPSEIAETLGIPPGTARSRLYNAHRDGTGLRTILPLSDFRPRGIDWGPAASKQLFDRASFNADGAPSA
jgi:RNA polymerase sigma-70 factor (ECF subfamily)